MEDDILKTPLPPEWSFGVMQDGRIFFINDKDKITSWLHPDTGEPVRTGNFKRLDLPRGWEEGFSKDGSYFINHNNRTTVFEFPDNMSYSSNMNNNAKLKNLETTEKSEDPPPSRTKIEKKRSGSFKAVFSPTKSLFRRSSSKAKSANPKESKQKDTTTRPISARSNRSTSSKIKVIVNRRNPDVDATKSGWLYKQDTSGKMRMWRKRWFVLVDFCLYYYKDTHENEILGSIVLPSYTIETLSPSDKINRKYAFKVEHSGMRTYYFSAESYNEMAEWITRLREASVPKSPEKKKSNHSSSGSHVSRQDSKKSPKKKTIADEKNDSDSEFGFNQYKPSTSVSSTTSSNSVIQNGKAESPVITKPAKSPKQDHVIANKDTPKRFREVPMKQPKQNEYVNAPTRHSPQKSAQPAKQKSPQMKHDYVNQAPPQKSPQKKHDYVNQAPQSRLSPPREVRSSGKTPRPSQQPMKRENGESAYYSDTSGATENSRNHASREQNRARQQSPRNNGNRSPVKRDNSLAKINEWATERAKQKSQPKSATMTNGYRSHKSRRHKAQTYNEYMDSMEVASSIMSMPPVKQSQRARTMPRPRSTENINNSLGPVNERRYIAPSKSVGNIMREQPPQQTTNPYHMKRSKSDYVNENAARKSTNSTTSPRSPMHDQWSPRSTEYNDNVFSPRSIVTSQSPTSSAHKHTNAFNYEDSIDAAPSRSNRIRRKDVMPESQPMKSHDSPHKTSQSSYEVKQMTKGHLRAFVISSKANHPNNQIVDTTGRHPTTDNSHTNSCSQRSKTIEAKSRRLNSIESSLDEISTEITKLQDDRERLEDALVIAKSRLQSEWTSGNHEITRDLTREQKQLEKNLFVVKTQLSNAAHKLQEIKSKNETFENEVNNLKVQLLNELNTQRPGSRKELEWELDRVERMMDKINKNKRNIEDKFEQLRHKKHDDDLLSLTPKAPSSMLSARSEARSPRDVKRVSHDRRNPRSSSTNNPNKFYTLPGRGVSQAKSVDSLTAASITSSTSPRPLSARSYSNVNGVGRVGGTLTRTKSATERLFQSSQPNVSFEKEANDIKRMQREINRNLRRTLNSGNNGTLTNSPRRQTYAGRNNPKIGMDVQTAMKHHKMPKVLQRANRDQARAETEKQYKHYDEIDHHDVPPPPPVNMNIEILAPDKVHIPERLMEFDFSDRSLSPGQLEMKESKVKSIERILARSGQQASMSAVHMAAALSVEAGSAARAVAVHAMESEHPEEFQTEKYQGQMDEYDDNGINQDYSGGYIV